jgi:hypothetical protein
MDVQIIEDIKRVTGATKLVKKQVVQALWSDYGYIARLELDNGQKPPVIIKFIDITEPTNHPRGWNTNLSHIRKVKSYEVEAYWYAHYNKTTESCRTPKCLFSKSYGNKQVLLLEDLDEAGFPLRKESLTIPEVKLVLNWLACFHAIHLSHETTGLWSEGTYWHLGTRPDEWKQMDESPLKANANGISEALKTAKFQTLLHGDAKLANFCFSTGMDGVSAVDFQYIGGGCGMKDVAYFLGSCISEDLCRIFEEELLTYYFSILKSNLTCDTFSFDELELEWRNLYPYAWADFTRFLIGWMPSHTKLNGYAKEITDKVVKEV